MISVSKEGGQIINFSSRFTLTGMTGVFGATVQQGITAVGSDTAGPKAINQVANSAAGTTAAAGAAGGQFTVPYQLQTGLTKYAPMQPVPGTKITATAFTPLHPTSAYTLATTYMGTPIVATTLTLSQTFSVSSMENTVRKTNDPMITYNGLEILTFCDRLLPPVRQPVIWPSFWRDGRTKYGTEGNLYTWFYGFACIKWCYGNRLGRRVSRVSSIRIRSSEYNVQLKFCHCTCSILNRI